MNNEVNINEEFGYNIYQTIVKYNLKQNLEIGSWDGEGSTNCFVQAMKLLTGDLFLGCIEVIPEKINFLANLYKDVPFVHPIENSSISYDELIYKSFDDVWNSQYNKIPKHVYNYDLVKSWYDRDVELLKTIEKGAITKLADKNWDSVLIDGGEFTGYSEYLLLKDKARVFYLDDVHSAFKCYEIYNELLNNNDWNILFDLPHVRNGAAAFIRK
jgi:hypothetical protein